jgi:hypothetical protein
MASKNAGEQEGKVDYGILFDDFPNCWEGTLFDLVIKSDWDGLIKECLKLVTPRDVHNVRVFGVVKYARMNWRESRWTSDHENFMNANRRSMYRHLMEDPLSIDPESGCYHIACVCMRAMIAKEYAIPKIEEDKPYAS